MSPALPEPPSLPPLDHSAPGRPIRIRSTKYDGSPHYEYWGRLIDVHEGVIRVVSDEGAAMSGYRGDGVLRTSMTQLFFTDRWYNVFHNYEPIGRWQMAWYANIGTPARIDGDTLHWVDLDIDLIGSETRGLFVDDEDEFEEHRVRMAYPDEVVARVLAARDELLALARRGAFPLDRASHLPQNRRVRPPPA